MGGVGNFDVLFDSYNFKHFNKMRICQHMKIALRVLILRGFT